MRQSYLLLHDPHDLDPEVVHRAQHDEGLRVLVRSNALALFASEGTRAFQLPHGAIIVGDLYSHDGHPVLDANQLDCDGTDAAFRHRILNDFWGEYIVVSPDRHNPSGFSVMRSPSHACELPCLYSTTDGASFVTSDISLALQLGIYRKHVDFDTLAHRLVYPSLKTSRTGLSGISELLPGCSVQICEGRGRIDESWSPWGFVSAANAYEDPGEAAAAVRSTIETVVSTLASQDGTVLLELSGGLDSSIIAVCLKQAAAKVKCATLTAPVPGADEREYASPIAAMLGTELITTEVAFGDALLDFALPPTAVNPAVGALQHLSDKLMEATAVRVGANSYFSGAGGDTVFCYLTDASPVADAFRSAGFSQGLRTLHDLSTFHQCTYWKAGRLALKKLMPSSTLPYKADTSLMPQPAALPELERHPWLTPPKGSLPGDRQRIFELSATQLFRDSCPRTLNRPVRMPLLTQPAIEACLRAPSWMWFSGAQNRAIARQAFADELPQNVYARKSKGTFTGFLGALYRRNRSAMRDFLLDGELHAHGLLDADALIQFTQGELPRGDGSFMRIFQFCAMENWVRQQPRIPVR